jgi:methylenetetrahydrofolate dehydrogenase (NADP+)/methenyltetrahydrofolate cyclohydrolase
MAPLILNGLELRTRLSQSLKMRISMYPNPLGLIVFSFGTDERSQAYVQQKIKFGEVLGVRVFHVNLPQETNMEEALTAVRRANNDYESQGIIIQLPVPPHLDADALCDAINPGMDVDGLHPVNQGLLMQGRRGIMPATAKAVITLLDHYQIPIEGKKIVVIGRSSLVGKPLALALVARDATITIAHSRTLDIPNLTRSADIVITAVGK